MKAAEMRGLTDEQLDDLLHELHAEWRHLRFQDAIGKLTATARIGQIRRDIARVHTIRTEREIEMVHRALLGGH